MSSLFSLRRGWRRANRCLLLAGAAVLCVLLMGAPAVVAQDEDEDSPFAAGLLAEYRGADQQVGRRVDATIAFTWREGRPDVALNAGPFAASWRGYLMSEAGGDYRLHVHVCGQVQLKLNGEQILSAQSDEPRWFSSAPVPLTFAWHPLEITYERGGSTPRLALFWSGPNFDLEPVDVRHLYHDAQASPVGQVEEGRRLARALRCDACHRAADTPVAMLGAPDLRSAAGQLHPRWLREHLSSRARATPPDEKAAASRDNLAERKMPYFALNEEEVEALVAFLSGGESWQIAAVSEAELAPGRQLFLTIGCLACHSYGRFGSPGLFGGGDLSHIAEKRPPGFFAQWLEHPEQLNPRHRMPVFELTAQERSRLAQFLSSLARPERQGAGAANGETADGLRERGRTLFRELRCGQCHEHPAFEDASDTNMSVVAALGPRADWNQSCLSAPRDRQPGFDLKAEQQQALRAFYASRGAERGGLAELGRYVMEERNCVSCHARGAAGGLAARLADVLEAFPELSPSIAAMSPPSLNSVGDKLHDEALRKAIQRQGAVRRPWLLVRMPKFALPSNQLDDLLQFLIDQDRLPDDAPWRRSAEELEVEPAIGARLVTPDGFGCTSCHAVGKVRAPNSPINTMGPDLLMMGERIRRPWYERWVRSPARIVPRMEMPSVQIPVRGVLHDNLDAQLAAVWHTLNRPDFRPPEPNPIRVVRRSGRLEDGERALVLTDVLQSETATYIKPLLIALPSRDNLVYDLSEGRLAEWWTGDAARQRAKGKSWLWEAAGRDMLQAGDAQPELGVTIDGRRCTPLRQGQFITEIDEVRHPATNQVDIRHRLHFRSPSGAPVVLHIVQQFRSSKRPNVVERWVNVSGVPEGAAVALRLPGPWTADQLQRPDSRQIAWSSGTGNAMAWSVRGEQELEVPAGGRTVQSLASAGQCEFQVSYERRNAVDEFPLVAAPVHRASPDLLHVAPGFVAQRLPLPEEFMPTCLTWNDAGELLVGSLKGRVWRLRDTDGDQLEDSMSSLGVELAAPYGLAAGPDYLDVLNKYALLRLIDEDRDGQVDRIVNVASGWGHTEDYHDWAVGLPSDGQGGYYAAWPCQQDQRSPEAAHLRGVVGRLVPRQPTSAHPRRFEIEPVSAGHRFPMGLARNRHGDLFATDNQGNFNPFNELNHVRPGAHFGFINTIDRRPGYAAPPLHAPAIDIPHPWTRSVNGICFLEHPTPEVEARAFGPFAGHLLGCEYDTRRLIRMSLQRVGDTLQGAAYPLTVDYPREGAPLLGPIACGISPAGDIYIGSLRDSGWGGSNNIGEIVRLRRESLPAGIAEVRAKATGFEIEFTRPVDGMKAARAENYVVSSYRRISTPDYGGPDVDRRSERPRRVTLSPDRRQVQLEFDELRAGFVYEFHLRSLAEQPDAEFFPAQAYYTLRVKP